MKTGFPGFPPEMLKFFRGLVKNNRREWFQARKQVFEEKVRQPMEELVSRVNAELARFAPDYITEPKKAIFRIYRDTRFSTDKTPYKDHQGAVFNHRRVGRMGGAGYYFSVSHKQVEVAGGVYMPDAGELMAIRHWLAEHHEEFRKTAEAKKVKALMGELEGERLSRVPKGFPADHPAAGLLRGKHWYYYALLEPELALTPRLLPEIVARFRVMAPLIEMLNRPLLDSSKESRAPAPAYE